MLAHRIDALERGQDIGHYGLRVLAMEGHRFAGDDLLVALLTRDPEFTEPEASALRMQLRRREGHSSFPRLMNSAFSIQIVVPHRCATE